MMLRHIGEGARADRIGKAVLRVLAAGVEVTGDLGGCATTKQYTDAVIRELQKA